MRFLLIFILILCGCQSLPQKSIESTIQGDQTKAPGWVSAFQTMTTDRATNINILRPRYAHLYYYLSEYDPQNVDSWKNGKEIKKIRTTKGKKIHWEVDRVLINNLDPEKTYQLSMVNRGRNKTIDWRVFKTLPVNNNKTRFILGSCMSDSFAYEHVRSRIWDQMLEKKADFIVLLGDEVYVDDFDFVKRNQATEFDIWTRYIDSFRKIPLFQNRQLIPILAVWDDHDFGTNNSDKTFKSKESAKKIFQAFFGGEPLKNYYEFSRNGVSFSFKGFGQKFIFMDNRYFRDPVNTAPFGQWGKEQHQWFERQISESKSPIWLANGGQFFAKATVVERDNGTKKQVNESFVDDHPKHFKKLLQGLKGLKQPAIFLSGDIHYSEIAKIEKELLGYETYEITSSPIHSFIFRNNDGSESWLNNPRRIVSVKEHNYLVVDFEFNNKIEINVKSFGVKQESPYFEQDLVVDKKL